MPRCHAVSFATSHRTACCARHAVSWFSGTSSIFPKLKIPDGDLGYSAVIEALWKLHPSEADRKEFFRDAQKRWAAVKDNEEEKQKIIEAARQLSDD